VTVVVTGAWVTVTGAWAAGAWVTVVVAPESVPVPLSVLSAVAELESVGDADSEGTVVVEAPLLQPASSTISPPTTSSEPL
jgi:hypothetical protein